jgi:ketose-bisphosphate aldolase
MIVNLSQILRKAEEGKFAVIAPDFISLFMAKVMIEQAEELQAPLILSYSALFKPILDVRRYDSFIRIIRDEIEAVDVPICLHQDHATNLDDIKEAVEVGFTSVMIDASFESWEVNVERTLKTMDIAKPAGVSVESELGHVTTGEYYYTQDNVRENLTDPDKAEEFVKLTGIDALAVAIGNVHGAYQGEPNIDFQLLAELNKRITVPLVLHGSSGTGEENIAKAIQLGIRKVNVFSEIVRLMHFNVMKALEENPTDPLRISKAQESGVRQVLAEFLKISGSINTIER